ncbi:hypothetical protein Fot_05357 [Forsythia ovata]|uniref:Uncharacterized protein n=1 Tax=Forsythia ovata TaxID=205694 RepID=A0ABD1WSR1_9LAMI
MSYATPIGVLLNHSENNLHHISNSASKVPNLHHISNSASKPAIEEKPEQTRRNRGKPEQTQTPEQRGPLGRRQRRVNRWRRRRQRRVNHQNSEGHSDGDRGASIGGEDGDRGVNGGSPGSVDF